MDKSANKKPAKCTAAELSHEELAQIAGGCNAMDTATEAEYVYPCMYCGAIVNAADSTCTVCGKTTIPVGAAEPV